MIKESDEVIKVESWAYKQYINAMGGWILYFFILLANLGFMFTSIYGVNYLLLDWANYETLAEQ